MALGAILIAGAGQRPSARAALCLALVVACTCSRPGGLASPAPVSGSAAPPVVTAFDVDTALARVGSQSLWPGFDPRTTPVAVYDGKRTVLFRHPRPPTGYVPLSGRENTSTYAGRDSLVTGNSSVTLGGVATATVLLDTTARRSPNDWAALTMHEIFHVFQRRRHPSWQGNEVDLFTYAVDDTVALALRRHETIALHRALAAESRDSARCWARAAVDARRARFASLGNAAAAYERGTELNEGLAQYVERRAAGRPITLAEQDLPADQVRQRSYEVGAAMAALLDELLPAWRDTLEIAPAAAGLTLDGLLERALENGRTPDGCAPSASEQAAVLDGAREDIRLLGERNARTRAAYLGQPGWRVIVESAEGRLFPQGFDPLNLTRLTASEVLHSRFLRLGSESGSIELLGRAALTEGRPGQHPLFAGVRRLTVAGLPEAPVVSDSAGVISIRGAGLRAALHGARVAASAQTIQLRIR